MMKSNTVLRFTRTLSTLAPSKTGPVASALASNESSTNRIYSSYSNGREGESPSQSQRVAEIFPGEITSLKSIIDNSAVDWTSSYPGVASKPFSTDAQNILLAPVDTNDIEIKPDGLLYLPEIKYRRILSKAFGPGGWALVPRGPHHVIGRTLTREWALVVDSRFVSCARGEQDFFAQDAVVTATEGVKSNALMRCCKDIGIASELWDPVFIRRWKAENSCEVWATDIKTKQRKRVWRRKDEKLGYPYQEM